MIVSIKQVSRALFLSARHPKATRVGVAKLDESGLSDRKQRARYSALAGEAGFPRPVQVEAVRGTLLGGRR